MISEVSQGSTFDPLLYNHHDLQRTPSSRELSLGGGTYRCVDDLAIIVQATRPDKLGHRVQNILPEISVGSVCARRVS